MSVSPPESQSESISGAQSVSPNSGSDPSTESAPTTSDNKKHQQEMVQLITSHQTRLRGFIRCLMLNPQDAEDVLQETNIVLWQKIDTFQPGTDFWAWASQIARFKVLSQFKKYGRDKLLFSEDFVAQISDVAEKKSADIDDRKIALEQCLQRLSPPQRQLIELCYCGDRTIREVAEAIGRPDGSVRQTLYRLRGMLQSCIQSKLQELAKPATGGQA